MVDIIGSIKKAWNLMFHPSTIKQMGIGEAIGFYYSFGIIYLLISIILSLITGNLLGIIGTLVDFFGFTVLGFIIIAAIYHLFGKFLFRKFKNTYSATFTAVVASVIPSFLIAWWILAIVNVIGIVFLASSFSSGAVTAGGLGSLVAAGSLIAIDILLAIIFGIWGLIILTLALAKLHNVSSLIAFLSWFIPTVILTILIVGIAVVVLGIFNGSALGSYNGGVPNPSSSCIASSGFICQIQSAVPSSSGAIITLSLGENTGANVYNATVAIAPFQSGTTPTGYPTTAVTEAVGNLNAGIPEIVSFTVPSSYLNQNEFEGYIWLNYSNTPNGPSTSAVKLATLAVPINST